MNPLQCSLECLRRADLPVGTMELAQYLTREVHRKRRLFESGNPYVSGPRSPSIS
jgi:hypothetical protein